MEFDEQRIFFSVVSAGSRSRQWARKGGSIPPDTPIFKIMTQEQLESKQLYLTLKMRDDSTLGESMCGAYDFCRFCDKSKDNPCARALYAFEEKQKENVSTEFAFNVALPPLALKLRTLRLQKHFTVEQVAKVCKISVEDLLYYEMGRKAPPKETLDALISLYY